METLAKGREWGRKIQYDLVDGALEAIERYGLDKNKVGIMGGSFGGYSGSGASWPSQSFSRRQWVS